MGPIDTEHQLPAPLPQTHPGIKFGIIVVILLIIAGLTVVILHRRGATAAAAGGGGRHGAGAGPASITVTTARKDNIGVYIQSIGTVTPEHTVSIFPQVTGPIKNVYFSEGQLVKKGDHLIDIDPAPYQATLDQANGILRRDQGLLAQAKMDLARYQKAWQQNKAISEQVLQDQEKLVEQDNGTVENDLGVVAYDKIQVGYCHITSPIDGRVGLRLIDPGNLVIANSNSSTPLAVITQLTPITVVFPVPEDDIEQVVDHMEPIGHRPCWWQTLFGAPLSVESLDRTADKRLDTGKLLTLDNQIDTVTGTVKARAEFPNKNSALFPNQFVNAKLKVYTLTDVTVVPSAAIQHNEQEAFVYVITTDEKTNKKIAAVQDVTPGMADGDLTEVQGITPGTVVAESGFERLTDKAEVMISPGGGGGGSAGGGAATQASTQRGHGGHRHGAPAGQPTEDAAP